MNTDGESRVFWLSLVMTQVFWVVFVFAALFTLSFKWFVSALLLSYVNVIIISLLYEISAQVFPCGKRKT